MNYCVAEPPSHAEVTNFTSYTLNDALGLYQVQPKPDGLNVVGPTYPGKDESMDSSSLPRSPGLVDQLYPSHVVAGYTSIPIQIGVVSIPTHAMNMNHLEFRNEEVIFHRTTSGPTSLPDRRSNRPIRHNHYTPHATSSDIINAATGPDKAVNKTFQTNPGAGPQKKPRIDEYGNCAPKKCLYRDADGKHCSQAVTCATVSDHFIGHGITKMSRGEVITCQWVGCSEKIIRHNFVRHIREKHLGHTRGSAIHGSEKDGGQRTSNAGLVEVEMSH